MSKFAMPAISVAALAAARPAAVIGGVYADGGDPETLLKKVEQKLDTLNGFGDEIMRFYEADE